MKALFCFALGFSLAITAMSYAQSGFWTDQQGRQGQFYQFPGGSTHYWTPDGRQGDVYQFPNGFNERKPC